MKPTLWSVAGNYFSYEVCASFSTVSVASRARVFISLLRPFLSQTAKRNTSAMKNFPFSPRFLNCALEFACHFQRLLRKEKKFVCPVLSYRTAALFDDNWNYPKREKISQIRFRATKTLTKYFRRNYFDKMTTCLKVFYKEKNDKLIRNTWQCSARYPFKTFDEICVLIPLFTAGIPTE